MDSGTEIFTTPQRSGEVRSPAPGEPGFDQVEPREFECQFDLEPGTFDGLQVRDPRVLCKVIAVDPGNSSMVPVASDVYGVDMDLINGAAGRVTEARMFSGS